MSESEVTSLEYINRADPGISHSPEFRLRSRGSRFCCPVCGENGGARLC